MYDNYAPKNIMDKYVNLFNRRVIDNPDFAKLTFHCIVGQLPGVKEMRLRCKGKMYPEGRSKEGKKGDLKMADEKEISISLTYAKDIHSVLESAVSMGFEIVSQEIKDLVSDEAYNKLYEIFAKHHNSNCGPFNRKLRRLIEIAETEQSGNGISK